MVRILHTSDWHLGASLEACARDEDHARFLRWLGDTLRERAVDVLVVAGDVFDQPQPSAESLRLYYGFLAALVGSPVRAVVIVGGNHDSAARLDAPQEVLQPLGVHVVGGLPDAQDRSRCVVPIPGATGGVEAVVLAVPYVNEVRLGVRAALASESDVAAALRAGIADVYRGLCDEALARFDGAPLVATGHLACVGGDRDDAPWEIHRVGHLGALPPDVFDPRLQYVALGHLHRSFRVGGSRARYSGSPIALSIKEGRTARRVLLVETDPSSAGEARVEAIEVPDVRPVLEIAGTAEAVKARLAELSWTSSLPPLVHARVEVPHYGAEIPGELRKVVEGRRGERPILFQVTQRPPERAIGDEVAAMGGAPSLAEQSPDDVLRALCRDRGVELDPTLLGAFHELIAGLGVDGER